MAIANFEARVMKVIQNAVPAAYKKVKITHASHLSRDLGIDSLALVSLIFGFEEEFGVEIDGIEEDFDMASLRTVGDVLRIGKEILEKAGAA
ncbi:MAG: phosphopantetheine-binding protein [Polyangiaceae bacterium]